MNHRGYEFHTSVEKGIVKDIKEKMCFVVDSFDYAMKEAEESNACEKNYDMPDGTKILVGNERFRAPEIMFNPRMAGLGSDGLHKYCQESIMKVNPDIRQDLYSNIVLSGGSTLFDGMS